jgi:hypothetical protein
MEMTINTQDLNATRTLAAESLENQNPSTAYDCALTSTTYEVIDGEPSPYVIPSRPTQR